MKSKITFTINIVLLLLVTSLGSCKKYLDVLPKGKKIPTTLADFEALVRDEYTNHRAPVTQAVLLLNDRWESQTTLNGNPLWKVNYYWDANANRIDLNTTDESVYYTAYAAISTFNLILQYAPAATDASDADKNQLMAQAKLGRAMHYFILANYYADTYEASNASSKLSVPLIESAEVNAPHKQVTIQEMYDFIISTVTEAIPNLPDKGATVVHGTKGAAYAFLARVYLQMNNYDQALSYANQALAVNDKLFDYVAFYNSYKAQIDLADNYPSLPNPRGYNYVENYIMMHGEYVYSRREWPLRADRAARFETGDASLLSRWKSRLVGSETYFYAITTGYFNEGGITTTEVYMIKAECLARKNDLAGAMDALNTVRAKRILPANYVALTAGSTKDAIDYIRRTKENETLFNIVSFADVRRFNKDPLYAKTFTKTENGATVSLKPDSHLWTMPIPLGAVKNSGNGTIQQNVNQ
ncbi:RagB/SusD family nutrient uptake outer membrane protein [Niastella sp. OAS944]|uniref:RagB/SusD family nutrient uptake outer membrane protein n=1 Tax=Niastella sp. OAS944 TaxID=2664089 RepID=UPI0034723206|nr:tetratricopeptide (TPR) repeat protein [Chitinophagaceae bacterium OAS944]